jgi:hypothetical protein
VDALLFRGQENDWTFARVPDGGDYWDYIAPRSRDTANPLAPPRVVISEFLYHTGFVTNLADPGLLEYVELFNGTGAPAPLFNETGLWRLSGGVGFEFPPNTTLAAGERIVVVPFAPTDTAVAAVFRATYGVPATTRLFGPWTGRLDNDTDRITLERPLAPDLPGEPSSIVAADEVIYFDREPWPGGADGNGFSYHRTVANRPGNDPAQWFAATPSPGRESAAPTGDEDGDGMPTAWELAHGLDPADPNDAGLDPDQDGLTNLEEYRAGTDPHEHSVRLDIQGAGAGLIEFTFLAPAGKQTGIESAGAVGSGAWVLDPSTVAPAQAVTRERTVIMAAPLEAAAHFYRVRIW